MNVSVFKPLAWDFVLCSVLHTGKRWFIICPVEEAPAASQDASSDGGPSTQSPSTTTVTDGTAQPSESASAQPPEPSTGSASASMGNVGLRYYLVCIIQKYWKNE